MNANVAPFSVSIAMATYNGERFLLEQLNSLAAQSLLPSELVVTDDGSTDKTIELLEQFGAVAPFSVRIFRNPRRLGFADNFIKAAELCTGELISFCDQDDIWLPEKLRVASSAFTDDSILMASHSAELMFGDSKTGKRDPDFKFTKIIRRGSGNILQTFPGFSLLFRSDLIRLTDNYNRPANLSASGTLPASLAHDGWISLLAATFGNIAIFSETLVLYRQHDGNTWGARSKPTYLEAFLRSVNANRYDRNRIVDESFSEFFLNLEPALPSAYKDQAVNAAQLFRRRAGFYGNRDLIYNKRSLPKRLKAFARILFSGGYFDSRNKATLGGRALLKDIVSIFVKISILEHYVRLFLLRIERSSDANKN